jgi:hypothetical protein
MTAMGYAHARVDTGSGGNSHQPRVATTPGIRPPACLASPRTRQDQDESTGQPLLLARARQWQLLDVPVLTLAGSPFKEAHDLLITGNHAYMKEVMSHHPTPRTEPANSDATRLFSKISVHEDCWEYTGYLDPDGYGRFYFQGKSCGAHRVAYQLAYGDIPQGMAVDHTCNNRACIRFEHLEAVTTAENNRRAAERRTHCRNGHPWDERNTYWHKEGKRNCRRCNAEAVRRYAARRRSGSEAHNSTRGDYSSGA